MIFNAGDSLISSVPALNVTPKKVILLFFKLLFNKFLTLVIKILYLFSFDLITDLTIDKFVLNDLATKVRALVSFGKHEPP